MIIRLLVMPVQGRTQTNPRGGGWQCLFYSSPLWRWPSSIAIFFWCTSDMLGLSNWNLFSVQKTTCLVTPLAQLHQYAPPAKKNPLLHCTKPQCTHQRAVNLSPSSNTLCLPTTHTTRNGKITYLPRHSFSQFIFHGQQSGMSAYRIKRVVMDTMLMHYFCSFSDGSSQKRSKRATFSLKRKTNSGEYLVYCLYNWSACVYVCLNWCTYIDTRRIYPTMFLSLSAVYRILLSTNNTCTKYNYYCMVYIETNLRLSLRMTE